MDYVPPLLVLLESNTKFYPDLQDSVPYNTLLLAQAVFLPVLMHSI